MSEKKGAVIDISKALMGVSFATLAAIGSASGSMVVAGLTAIPTAVLAVGPLLAKHKFKKKELLELPLPPWWTSDTRTWNNLCNEIGDHLPHILQKMATQLQSEQGVVTTQVVRRIFIDAVAGEQLVWEFDPQQKRNVATEIAAPVLYKVAEVLKTVIEPIRQDTVLVDAHKTAVNTEKLVEALEKAILILGEMQKQGKAAIPDIHSVVISQVPELLSTASAPADVLQHKIENDSYDVYICYHEADKAEVFKIGEQLKTHGILPWFDIMDVKPGIPARLQQEQQIEKIPSAAIFVGQQAIANWQALEMYAFVGQFVQRSCPVIPVLLANAPQEPKLPVFLANFGWVDFRRSLPEPMKQLIWGITGKRL